MEIHFLGHGKVMENHCWKRVVTLNSSVCILQPKEEMKTVENDTDNAETAPSAKQPKLDEEEVCE